MKSELLTVKNFGCHSLACALALAAFITPAAGVSADTIYVSGPTPNASPRFKTIEAGYLHSLAVQTNGTVLAWGYNCCGLNTVPDGLSDVVAVAPGNNHNLALKSDGTVVAWGDSSYHQSPAPAGLNNVVGIAGGELHSLAVRADGTVVAWGIGESGPPVDPNDYGQARVPAGLSGVVAVAAGFAHNLALKSDGTVVAWGDNTYGQTSVRPDATNVVAIAAGRYHSLALKADGTVVAWGDNRLGQNNMPAGLNGVVAISARIYDSMALKSDGTVVTWGYYSSYYAVPAGLNNVVAIATGGSHFLALRSDGSIVAWGDNGFGQTAVPGTLVPDHNIQDAVNAAHDGDTVLVAPGEYNLVNQITITKAITVRSTASPGQTFLNSRSNIWCLWISNSLAVADGFTLQNPERVSQTAQAGGAFIVGGTVQNCLITNFSLSRIGSAVIVKGGTLRNSIVPYRSEAPGSSAAYCTDDGLITGCQIVGSSGGPNRSMAVYLENGRLQYSLVSGDFYVSNSGEVAVKALSSTITGCTIMNNFNLGQGGGAYLENSVMDRCIVTGNGCGTGGGRGSGGGGVFATNSLIRDSLIASNRVFMSSAEPTAGGYGGGVYMQGGALVNCTVSGNIADDFGSAPGAGGGVYAESAGVTNSIIYFNTLRTGSAGSNWFGFGPTTFDHCCTAPDPGGAGNITQDPQFLDASNGDFHPASTSPCINAGVTQPWMIGAYDLDGNPRVSGTSVDIGAYETPATTRQDLAEALMAEVNSLVADGILSHGHGNSLLASLRPALNNMNRGNTETACGQVGAFIGKVQQFTAAGELSQGDGSALIGAASDLQTALGCGGQTNSGQQKAPARRSFSPR